MPKTGLYVQSGKRVLDLLLSTGAIFVLAPLFLLIAGLVATTSEGGVLFRQERVGRNGRVFRILKFRTMVAGAERMGPGITRASDSRITSVGRVLRRYKLDELPQLINVLMGDMSLVGPRPELPQYVNEYPGHFQEVLKVRPGITDPASIAYRDEESLLDLAGDSEQVYRNVVLPAKLNLNRAYIRRMSLRYDLGLLLRTVIVLPRNPSSRARTETTQDA